MSVFETGGRVVLKLLHGGNTYIHYVQCSMEKYVLSFLHLCYCLYSIQLLPTSPLCVHVTDCGEGRPAEGMTVELTTWQSSTADWTALGSG